MVKKMVTKRRKRKQKRTTEQNTETTSHIADVSSASNKRPLPKKNQREIVVLKTNYDDLRKRVVYLENEIIYMKCQDIISIKMEEQLAAVMRTNIQDGPPTLMIEGGISFFVFSDVNLIK